MCEDFRVNHTASKHPYHFLARDDALEKRLSDEFRRAFGVDLVLHRTAGSKLPLYAGERPAMDAGEDRVSQGYVRRLEKLDRIENQGDGMRSFAGVLLATSVGQEMIMLIDEPEAFLHPAQARLLGNTLVAEQGVARQMIIATHSTDFLRGVLDSERSNVKILKINRNGNANAVRLLSNERIRELWGDSLLRASSILDGLFHQMVVLCESDSDCRFYNAVLEAVLEAGSKLTRRPDLMFTHCGGKQRMATVVRALAGVNVAVRVVADFDVLSEQQPLQSIVEALGMTWSSVKPDWTIVKKAIDEQRPERNAMDVRSVVNQILDANKGTNLTSVSTEGIQKVLKRSSPWSHAKSTGKNFVPNGDASQACERLLHALRVGGLHVVEVGEAEGFSRQDGGHGPTWVNTVLKRDLAHDSTLDDARRFVARLVEA